MPDGLREMDDAVRSEAEFRHPPDGADACDWYKWSQVIHQSVQRYMKGLHALALSLFLFFHKDDGKSERENLYYTEEDSISATHK